MLRECYQDLMKTLSVNAGAFVASITSSIETILQITLLALSIAYTIKKLRDDKNPDDKNPKDK